ncbi:hypothetical protein [Streptomyces sp. NPDC008121]|uniref:hypothetical protein n=1 Tax=Streptomyces sp. NPDC008121 TaxID=3364809 RepID=UPI0036EF53C8
MPHPSAVTHRCPDRNRSPRAAPAVDHNRKAPGGVLPSESSPAVRYGGAPSSWRGIIATHTPENPIAPSGRAAGLARILLGGVAGALLTGAFLTVLWWPQSDVVYRSTAPSSVAYADRSPHFLGLVHEHTPSGRHSYRLIIGRDPSLSYGHWLDVDAALGAEGIHSTTWTESGVRVLFRTDHEVFVPARSFTFGR